MGQKKNEGKKKGGRKKHGRSRRKAEGHSKPLSRYVRGKITAITYFKLTGQKVR